MKHAIRSPEGMRFNLELAGPFARLFAWLIDAAIIQAASAVVGKAMMIAQTVSPDLAAGLYLILVFVITFGYSVAMEWFNRGQTVGKSALGLQVVDEDGLPLSFSQVFIRNVLRIVDTLPVLYLVGGVSVFVSRRAQRLGDIAARTIVIRNRKPEELDFKQAIKVKYNSLRGFARSAALLRQQVGPEKAGLALEALLRRDSLDDGARVNLFRQIRRDFEDCAAFPEEATLSLSDEQYVRNAVEILFEGQSRSTE